MSSRLAEVIYENNTERRAVAGDLDACPPTALWQVRLKIDNQSFAVGDPTDADHADWMRRQLAAAIEAWCTDDARRRMECMP